LIEVLNKRGDFVEVSSGASDDTELSLSETYTGNLSGATTQKDANDVLDAFEGGGGHEIYSQDDETAVTQRDKLRFKGFLKASDNASDEETEVEVDDAQIDNLDTSRFIVNEEVVKIKLTTGKYLKGVGGIAVEKTASEILSEDFSTDRFQTYSGKSDLKLTDGKVWVGDLNDVPEEVDVVSVFDILTATATEDGQLSFTNIDSNSVSVLGAGYVIENIILKSADDVGDISIGTTSSGTDVVDGETVNDNEVLATLGKTFFSTTTTQKLYVSSTAWGSGTLTLKIFIKKVWQ